LNVAVEIGDGKSVNIVIRENDDPLLVSVDFANRYGLSDQLREILEEQIRLNMRRVLGARQQ
jgi:hypothetical protein